MKTKAVRIYGKKDLRLDEFELPELKDDEILAHVISDSICMSSHKAALQGADHKRVPDDININPTIIGHEFAGVILEVGKKWQSKFKPGQKFSIQPAMNQTGSLNAPGYSFRYIGGDATHVIIPSIVMEADCLLAYDGEAFFLHLFRSQCLASSGLFMPVTIFHRAPMYMTWEYAKAGKWLFWPVLVPWGLEPLIMPCIRNVNPD